MNYSFVAISTLVKSDIGEKGLINFLINMPAQSLKIFRKELHQKRKLILLK